MDKSEAIKRLDALEDEAAKLRGIIEASDKIIYDGHKIYIIIVEDKVYILAGKKDSEYFRWHSFNTSDYDSGTENAYSSHSSGQEALDSMRDEGIPIHVFSDGVEAIQFFYDEYMKAHK